MLVFLWLVLVLNSRRMVIIQSMLGRWRSFSLISGMTVEKGVRDTPSHRKWRQGRNTIFSFRYFHVWFPSYEVLTTLNVSWNILTDLTPKTYFWFSTNSIKLIRNIKYVMSKFYYIKTIKYLPYNVNKLMETII